MVEKQNNNLYIVIPSNMEISTNVIRVMESVDVSENIHIFLVNQSDKDVELGSMYQARNIEIEEIKTGRIVPLSVARNLVLSQLYKRKNLDISKGLVMFVDDDAWFPRETIDFLLNCPIKAYCLSTRDPDINKSFVNTKVVGEMRGYHICSDIVSICMVVPLQNLVNTSIFFNEKLGLGNDISQGEESLFIYDLYSRGMKVFHDEHEIYHPYKKTFNVKNFYSLAYFFSMATRYVAKDFCIPLLKLLGKYTVALLLSYKDIRYIYLFKAVWIGYCDGKRDKKQILVRR